MTNDKKEPPEAPNLDSEDIKNTENTSATEEPNNKNIDLRLQKAVDILKKQTGVDEKKLKGLTLEEQFDRLEFLSENMPRKVVSKNEPPISMPIGDTKNIGTVVREGDKTFYHFAPKDWLLAKKEK